MSDTPGSSSVPDWVQKGILAIIAALTSVIAYFFRQLQHVSQTTIDELKKDQAESKARITAIENERLTWYEKRGEMLTIIAKQQNEIDDLKAHLPPPEKH